MQISILKKSRAQNTGSENVALNRANRKENVHETLFLSRNFARCPNLRSFQKNAVKGVGHRLSFSDNWQKLKSKGCFVLPDKRGVKVLIVCPRGQNTSL